MFLLFLEKVNGLLDLNLFAVLIGTSLVAQGIVAVPFLTPRENINLRDVITEYLAIGFLGLSSIFFLFGFLFALSFDVVMKVYGDLYPIRAILTGVPLLLGTSLLSGGVGEILLRLTGRKARFYPKWLLNFNNGMAEWLLPADKPKKLKVEIFTDGEHWFANALNSNIKAEGTSLEVALENLKKSIADYFS